MKNIITSNIILFALLASFGFANEENTNKGILAKAVILYSSGSAMQTVTCELKEVLAGDVESKPSKGIKFVLPNRELAEISKNGRELILQIAKKENKWEVLNYWMPITQE